MKLRRIMVEDGSVVLVFEEGEEEKPALVVPASGELRKPVPTKAEKDRRYREKKKQERFEESSMPQGSLPESLRGLIR